jgi:hypothetical protein
VVIELEFDPGEDKDIREVTQWLGLRQLCDTGSKRLFVDRRVLTDISILVLSSTQTTTNTNTTEMKKEDKLPNPHQTPSQTNRHPARTDVLPKFMTASTIGSVNPPCFTI